jgi:hypothetical protein
VTEFLPCCPATVESLRRCLQFWEDCTSNFQSVLILEGKDDRPTLCLWEVVMVSLKFTVINIVRLLHLPLHDVRLGVNW